MTNSNDSKIARNREEHRKSRTLEATMPDAPRLGGRTVSGSEDSDVEKAYQALLEYRMRKKKKQKEEEARARTADDDVLDIPHKALEELALNTVCHFLPGNRHL